MRFLRLQRSSNDQGLLLLVGLNICVEFVRKKLLSIDLRCNILYIVDSWILIAMRTSSMLALSTHVSAQLCSIGEEADESASITVGNSKPPSPNPNTISVPYE